MVYNMLLCWCVRPEQECWLYPDNVDHCETEPGKTRLGVPHTPANIQPLSMMAWYSSPAWCFTTCFEKSITETTPSRAGGRATSKTKHTAIHYKKQKPTTNKKAEEKNQTPIKTANSKQQTVKVVCIDWKSPQARRSRGRDMPREIGTLVGETFRALILRCTSHHYVCVWVCWCVYGIVLVQSVWSNLV